MSLKHENYDAIPPGERYRISLRIRGLDKPPLRSLKIGITLPQTSLPAGLDWGRIQRWIRPYRLSGKNPRPKLLVPVTHSGVVRLQVEVVKLTSAEVLRSLSIKLNEQLVSFSTLQSLDDTLLLVFEGMLKAADYSVIEFDLTPRPDSVSISPRRIGISNVQIVPISDH
jgi:hypothetical protein